eukprot:GHVH01008311.1.p1 GENE.GHVH01008311.1~~GHVH01008311.1.p1  ORF type:complete len:850 (+),score=81.09 GHVH01008311.1:253-2802(+)
MTGSQEKNMDNLSSLGNNAGFNQRSTFSDELARLSDSRGVSPQMIIKEGTLLKWFGWISTTLSPPWKPRIVKLKPGIMIVSSTSGDERLIPLVNRPNVITSDPARQQWIVDDGVGKLLYLKLPMSDPSDSYSVWNKAMVKARDHYEYAKEPFCVSHNPLNRIQASFSRNSGLEVDNLEGSDDGLNPLKELSDSISALFGHYIHLVDSILKHSQRQGDFFTSAQKTRQSHLDNLESQRMAKGLLQQTNAALQHRGDMEREKNIILSKLRAVKEQSANTQRTLRHHIKAAHKYKEKYESQKRFCIDNHQKTVALSSPVSICDGSLNTSGHVESENGDSEESGEFNMFESFESLDDKDKDLFEVLKQSNSSPVSQSISNLNEATLPHESGVVTRRTHLAQPRTEFKTSLWTTLKECVGRDLSRVALPVTFNEPTSFLQRTAEDFMYKEQLDFACNTGGPLTSAIYDDVPDSAKAACHVATFLISPYASALGRTFKPFNPLLGETYEISHKGFQYIAEQVSHHPPSLAYHSRSYPFEGNPDWVVSGNLKANQRFNGKSLVVEMKGEYKLELNKVWGANSNQSWIATRPLMCIDNIIFGKLKIELYGQAVAVANDGYCVITEYFRQTWFGNFEDHVRSVIYNSRDGKPLLFLSGEWSERLKVEKVIEYEGARLPKLTPMIYHSGDPRKGQPIITILWENIVVDPASGQTIWQTIGRPPHSSSYYEFSDLTFELNEITEDYDPHQGAAIPPTDSRFRPDQRLLELGQPQKSNEVKRHLEEKQRISARQRQDGESSWHPMWFNKHPTSDLDEWSQEPRFSFKGTYWDIKSRNGFAEEPCPDIFLTQEEINSITAND